MSGYSPAAPKPVYRWKGRIVHVDENGMTDVDKPWWGDIAMWLIRWIS